MRFLTVQYAKHANGKIDEVMGVTKRIRAKDIQMCNIILDFKEKKVQKCIVDGAAVDTDWDKLYAYFQPLYPAVIERLEYEADPVGFMQRIAAGEIEVGERDDIVTDVETVDTADRKVITIDASEISPDQIDNMITQFQEQSIEG